MAARIAVVLATVVCLGRVEGRCPYAPPEPPAIPDLSPDVESIVEKGDAAFLAERYDEAEALYRSALAQAPNAQFLLGKVETAATATYIEISRDDPQSDIFSELFRPDVLYGEGHPGFPPSTAPLDFPKKPLKKKIVDLFRTKLGAAFTKVASHVRRGEIWDRR